MKQATEQIDRTAGDAEALELAARERIAEWWRRADRLPHYPATSAEAVALLQAVEYDVDNATVHEFIDSGYLVAPMRRDGRLHWSAADIVNFAAGLEARRRWQKFSRLHDGKKTLWQRSKETQEANGNAAAVFNDLERYTLEDLLLLMVGIDDRNAREMLFTACQCKLEQSAA